MRVLVTGGAGFIGSQVVRELAAAGHEAVVFDALLPAAHPGGHGPREARTVVADLRDAERVRAALAGIDAVCHQAAMVGLGKEFADAPAYVGCNDLGTAVLLAEMAAAGVRDLVVAGSMVVYGEGRYDCARHGTVRPGPRAAADLDAGRFEPPCPECGALLRPGLVAEDAPTDPRNVYAATKLAQEHLASAWSRATGGRAVALRYHNVYGPGMPRDTPYAGVASFFRSALARGRHPGSTRTGRSGATSSTSGTWPAPTRWRWRRWPGGSRASSPRTTRGAGSRTPSGRWPPRWPPRTAGPHRWSPGSTGSATSATSPPTPGGSATNWGGSRRWGSPRGWRSSRRHRCGPARTPAPADRSSATRSTAAAHGHAMPGMHPYDP